MKKPTMKPGKSTMERPQGKPKARASGVNKPVEKAAIPQVVAEVRYGRPTQRQKM